MYIKGVNPTCFIWHEVSFDLQPWLVAYLREVKPLPPPPPRQHSSDVLANAIQAFNLPAETTFSELSKECRDPTLENHPDKMKYVEKRMGRPMTDPEKLERRQI
jgi:hypothetical protein